MSKRRVFLAHSSQNKDVVRLIAVELEKVGVEVDFDEWLLVGGDSLVTKLGEAIEAADNLIVFLSADAVKSPWVKTELASGLVHALAHDSGKAENFVVPIVLEDCQIPFFLKDRLYIDARAGSQTLLVSKIVDAVNGLASRPEAEQFRNVLLIKHPNNTYEIRVHTFQTNGFSLGVRGSRMDPDSLWFAPPSQPIKPDISTVVTHGQRPLVVDGYSGLRAQSPNLTSVNSLYFVASQPLDHCVFGGFHDDTLEAVYASTSE